MDDLKIGDKVLINGEPHIVTVAESYPKRVVPEFCSVCGGLCGPSRCEAGWDFFVSAHCLKCHGSLETRLEEDEFRCTKCDARYVLADLMPQMIEAHKNA